ncbi:MAG TPA: protein kinase [Gemmatimonadales bacterium]|nr:protein kinase [Gemmatimonadales bacterium]
MTTIPSPLLSSLRAALSGQYRLERELGAGGMGMVFLATDLALDRPVAIKVIHPELATHPSIAQRFLAEARMIARLRHPNIVAVHTAGEATGLLYYVMDYVEGESLRQRLQREGRLDPAAVERLVLDLADALDAAGRAGLVHRDVKPENVLIEQASGRALLADFGIARAMGSSDRDAITGQGLAVGTPTYMSPEQAGGEQVDSRSDLYSLGVVAYELLAGHPPFRGATSAAVASKHLSESPPPIDRLRPDVPAPLGAVIMRALAKSPEQRWQTGAEMRHSLVAPAAPAVQSRRSLMQALVGAAAVLLVAVGAWVMSRPSGPGAGVNPRHSLLILPFENLRRDPSVDWLREGSVNMLTLTLSQWNDLNVVEHERVHDLLAKAGYRPGEPLGLDLARKVARAAGVWTVVLGDFSRAGDSLTLSARMFDVASGRRVDVASVESRYQDDVRALYDQLAARLLDLSGAPADLRAQLSARTTGSLEAYRAYLSGLEELNRWDLNTAERDLTRAVQLDSTFALAYYKLSLTRGWLYGQFDSAGVNAIRMAGRHTDRLSSHDQVMVRAYQAFMELDYAGSRVQYQALLKVDTTDADAWYGLGDAWFHDPDTAAVDGARHNQESLRAFQRALSLDPDYYLAYEHTTWILKNASRQKPWLVLLPGDSLARAYDATGKALMDSTTVQSGIVRARNAGLRQARAWSSQQPDNPHAQDALIEQLFVSGDYRAADAEVERIRGSAGGLKRGDLPFVRARIDLARGDVSDAAVAAAAAEDSADVEQFEPGTMPSGPIREVLGGVNSLMYQGRLSRADDILDLASAIEERWYAMPNMIYVANRSGSHALYQGHLYAAAGGSASDLRRLWREVAEAARDAPSARRADVANLGWPAAIGLFLGQTGDDSALREFTALAGSPLPPEVQALEATAHGDSAGARRLLATTLPSTDDMVWKEKRPMWSGYRSYVKALVYFQLGQYDRSLDLLQGYRPELLETESMDIRWGLLGRARLLRGATLEKLGRTQEARQEYQSVLAQYDGADRALQPYLDQARLGLARLSGAG